MYVKAGEPTNVGCGRNPANRENLRCLFNFKKKTKGGEEMKFVEEEKYKNDIGIYKIVNLVNGRAYIGQTKEKFQRRYWLHRWKLRKGEHDNKHLQRAWDKYGEENFIFEVIEILPVEQIDDREKYWIDWQRKQKEGCYSIQDGGQPENLNDYISPEIRKRQGELNRNRMLGSKLSDETRLKMSETRKGKRVYRTNDTLTDGQAILVKQMFIEGKTSKEIQNELKLPYKTLNNILSNNAYSTVYVEGWEKFLNKHNQEKHDRKIRGKMIEQELLQGASVKELSEKYGLNRKTIEYYQKKLNKH